MHRFLNKLRNTSGSSVSQAVTPAATLKQPLTHYKMRDYSKYKALYPNYNQYCARLSPFSALVADPPRPVMPRR